jgi:Na+/proline symporter
MIFLLTGVMLWAFYQAHPFKIPVPEPVPGIKAQDYVFPIFMVTEMPHILKGFLIVAILSAAMSSVSSALTSLASVSTMDFVRHLLPGKGERFFLRFSKMSTVAWAAALVFVAYLSREVKSVVDAAFSLRGLTSGALLGGLILALFWKRGKAAAVIAGMLTSLFFMTCIQYLPKIPRTAEWWKRTVGVEVYWPWYTLIGAVVTIGVAILVGNRPGKPPQQA